ncbi:MAG: division plane positioning ATPase MipZ [Alphaproteobacteria bacterium]
MDLTDTFTPTEQPEAPGGPVSGAGRRRAHIVVLGNQKGGTGKSTTAMHLLVALLREDLAVASIDLDSRQGSLTRYIENRRAYRARTGLKLWTPDHYPFELSTHDSAARAGEEDRRALDDLLARLGASHDFIIVDCPGAVSDVVRHACSRADTLITPMNDSFVDFDLLARVDDSAPPRVLGPSQFSEFVWEQRKARAKRDGGSINWIVLRNRLNHLESHNMKAVGAALMDLAKRIGFNFMDGFGERVVFRELFPKGLTVLDLRERGAGVQLNLSHVAARQEIRRLMGALGFADASAETADR